MNIRPIRIHDFGNRKGVHAFVFALAMLSIAVNSANTMAADLTPDDYRVSVAGGKFEDTVQFAAAYRLRPPRRLRARYLELAVGALSGPGDTHPFVSFGPVWQLPVSSDRWFVQFGFSPTFISGSTFSDRDLGGNFHFTSSASFGAEFGDRRRLSVALRVQHTSNGGLNSTNPGIDMLGVNINYDFGP